LISINVGQEREISGAKTSGRTGIYKMPVQGLVQITRQGIPGDVIVDTKHHGGVDQAVYLYGKDEYDWWAHELGMAFQPGTFGEKLTIAGFESAKFSAGDRFWLGTVILEATSPRLPCPTLDARMNDPRFGERFKAADRPGLYCRGVQAGVIRAGEMVRVERYQGVTVSNLEMFRYSYAKTPPREYLERYLQAPTSARGRARIEEMLRHDSTC